MDIELLEKYLPHLGSGRLATIVALIFLVLGWFSKSGMDIWERWRRRRMEEAFDVQKLDLMEDEQLKDGFKFAIKKQDRQITKLEKRSEHFEQLHLACVEENAKMETTIEFMKREFQHTLGLMNATITGLEQKVEGYRKELKRQRGYDPMPSPPLHMTPEPEKKEGPDGTRETPDH